MNAAADDYSLRVLDQLRARLKEYAESVVRHNDLRDFGHLRMRIWLTTAYTLRVNHESVLKQARRLIGQDLRGADVEDIYYRISPETSPPDCRIDIDPPPYLEPPADDPDRYPVAHGWVLLRLSYMDYKEDFPLAPSGVWTPFGREVPLAFGMVPVRIAERVHAVPRGPLLHLRRRGDEVQLRRSGLGEDYLVLLDGAPLLAADVGLLLRGGTIAYQKRLVGETRLHYTILLET